MSTASSSTFISSCFDRPTPQTSSVYTEPPPVASLPESQPYVTPSLLTCEFLGFGDCDVVFDLNDESRWIAHIASFHLRSIFPTAGGQITIRIRRWWKPVGQGIGGRRLEIVRRRVTIAEWRVSSLDDAFGDSKPYSIVAPSMAKYHEMT
ncbi:hypothetical protein FGLOB1_12229 [Fusarium globosum]|uniref:Uncharacterized protein n=1 Tax=Fusarium globosum TaxID=78864 RepID=A0A8H6CZ04_9HYPO|nr:hypothetical protein FGLOB1_12229 [Fusarium globosum]